MGEISIGSWPHSCGRDRFPTSSGFVHASLFCGVHPNAHHCPALSRIVTLQSMATTSSSLDTDIISAASASSAAESAGPLTPTSAAPPPSCAAAPPLLPPLPLYSCTAVRACKQSVCECFECSHSQTLCLHVEHSQTLCLHVCTRRV